MPLSNFPQAVIRFEIETCQSSCDEKRLRKNNIAFTGTPQKHPDNPQKIVLVVAPYSENTFYYEFHTQDISFVEELANLVTSHGEVIPMARIWVKKDSIAVRSAPFVVGNDRI